MFLHRDVKLKFYWVVKFMFMRQYIITINYRYETQNQSKSKNFFEQKQY